jgi:spoIIIJ-associated protein
LALKLADQAVELARTMELEPMPANERRVIHLALRDHPAVRTESVGEGVDRKVTIIPKP